jgi:hypothetical protein
MLSCMYVNICTNITNVLVRLSIRPSLFPLGVSRLSTVQWPGLFLFL